MAYILMSQGEDAFIRTTLANTACAVPIPGGGLGWGLALATTAVGANTALNKERTLSSSTGATLIQEIGIATPNGYARGSIPRNATGWPNPTGHPGASYSSTAPQVGFTFSGAPTANGAVSWWLCKGTVVNIDNLMFGADLAATRNFANGDTESVTVSYQQT